MIQFLQKEPILWGPLFLLMTLALAIKTAIPFDTLLLATGGFFLSARWQIRGFVYSLALLAFVAAIKHVFLVTDHLWQLGLEGSLACAFFITALGFEQGILSVESLQSQIETRNANLQNLEDELSKAQEISQEQQIAFQEKIASLQKELEELQTEHSSILILNEVLRKTTARHNSEEEQLKGALHELETHLELLRGDYESSEKELKRLKDTDAIVLQNADLMRDLNQARADKEQTHLINETLARLHLREALKAKDADQEAASLKEQLRAAHQQRPVEKVIHISQAEPLFKQLKQQFEEKNQVLHEVRSNLFKTETELQKLKIEKAALELTPLPKEVETELEGLSSQIASLEEENQELQELVSILSDAPRAKKKVKTQRSSDEQELLF